MRGAQDSAQIADTAEIEKSATAVAKHYDDKRYKRARARLIIAVTLFTMTDSRL